MIPTSRDTAIPQVPRILTLVEDEFGGWEPLSRNVDLGGGPYELFTQALGELGVENLVYDPYNRSKPHNDRVARELDQNPADTATICDVFNVLITRKRGMIALLQKAKKWLKPGGRIYITVYEGNQSKKSQQSNRNFQANRPLWAYVPVIQEVFPDAHQRFGFIVATKS